tara:strand:- start:185 stop:433 length:249 start_codon:yes stop_codon:yes gene_type:complete
VNPHDLADVLRYEGFVVDYDTGEVYSEDTCDTLIVLVALGKLEIKRDVNGELIYYIPHMDVCDMQSYCDAFPNDVSCKMYDV